MINHYDPNQPRNAEGEWTDAGAAIQRAASDKKLQSEMDNFDWNSVYNLDTTAVVEDGQEILKKQKIIDNVVGEIDNKITENEILIADWQNRKYKSNAEIVFKGGDDIHGEGMSIGGINEAKRQKKINGYRSEIDSYVKAKELIVSYNIDRKGDILEHIRADFKNENYIIRGKKMSTRDQIILDDAYDKLITLLKKHE